MTIITVDVMACHDSYDLRLFNIAMVYMAHRNRWFTVLNSMVDLSMANCECHNQMVLPVGAQKIHTPLGWVPMYDLCWRRAAGLGHTEVWQRACSF